MSGLTIFWLTVVAALWYAMGRRLWLTYLNLRDKRDIPFRMDERVWVVTCWLWPLVILTFFTFLFLAICRRAYRYLFHRNRKRQTERDDYKAM